METASMFQSEFSTAEENGQRPLMTKPPSAFRPRPAASAMDEAISVRVRVPDFMLGRGVVVAQDPMMAAEIAHVPRRGRAAARELRRNVHHRDEIELHSPEGSGLVKTQQP